MSGPDFYDLVGREGSPEELAKLRRAHELLVAAGPPPELSPRLADAPPPPVKSSFLPRRRREAVLVLAAALAALAFGIGYLVGDRGDGFRQVRVVAMHGTDRAAAHADLAIGKPDGGNYPLRMTVRGLPDLPKGGWYELLLSKQGRPTLSCGPFTVKGGAATVHFTVPYYLSERPKLFDGWVVVRHLPKQTYAHVVMTT